MPRRGVVLLVVRSTSTPPMLACANGRLRCCAGDGTQRRHAHLATTKSCSMVAWTSALEESPVQMPWSRGVSPHEPRAGTRIVSNIFVSIYISPICDTT